MRLVSLIFFCIFALMNTFNSPIGHPPKNFIDKSLSREDSPRKLEEGNYISVTYHTNVFYNKFENNFRGFISYIYNHYDGKNYTSKENMNVHGNMPIDIYFSMPLLSLKFFFASRENLNSLDSAVEHIKFIDFSHFEAYRLMSMDYCFWGCINLETVNFGNFNAPLLASVEHMFSDCVEMKYLDLSTFNAPNILFTSYWFYNCHNLRLLDLSNVNLLRATSFDNLFSSYDNLGYINLTNSQISFDNNFSPLNSNKQEITKNTSYCILG